MQDSAEGERTDHKAQEAVVKLVSFRLVRVHALVLLSMNLFSHFQSDIDTCVRQAKR